MYNIRDFSNGLQDFGYESSMNILGYNIGGHIWDMTDEQIARVYDLEEAYLDRWAHLTLEHIQDGDESIDYDFLGEKLIRYDDDGRAEELEDDERVQQAMEIAEQECDSLDWSEF